MILMGLEERIKNMEALTLSFTNDIREEAINQIYSTLIKVFNNVDSLIAIINSETDTLEYINPAGIEHDIAAGTNIRHMIGSSCEVICKEINLPIKCEDCPLEKAKKDNKIHSIKFMSRVTNKYMIMTVIPVKFNGTRSFIIMFSDDND